MTDFAQFFSFKARTGSGDYAKTLPRGHAEVWHDSKRYVYDLTGFRVPKEFKAWVKYAWIENHNGDNRTLTGRYPTYYVE